MCYFIFNENGVLLVWSIGECNIGPIGAAYVANALQSNSSLQKLL